MAIQKITIYTCDRCKREYEGIGNPFGGHLLSIDDFRDKSRHQSALDLCYRCYPEVCNEIKEYAHKNRLGLLVKDGIVVIKE